MILNTYQANKTTVPIEGDANLAKTSSQTLASYVRKNDTSRTIAVIEDNNTSEKIIIPAEAFRLLVDILAQMAQGNAITLMPVYPELIPIQNSKFKIQKQESQIRYRFQRLKLYQDFREMV